MATKTSPKTKSKGTPKPATKITPKTQAKEPSQGGLFFEIRRKFIHFLNIWIPILYYYVDYHVMLGAISAGVISCLTLDLLRNQQSPVGRGINAVLTFTGLMELFRPHEKDGRLTGLTHVFLSALVCVVFFDRELFIISFTILIISDTLAAIMGSAYGQDKTNTGKSLAGTEAFSMSAICISLAGCWLFHLSYFAATCAALFASAAEHKSGQIKLDDNFVIPITYCIAYTLFALIGI